jgi:beta-lactam-binding protein with PASTA domain
VRRGRVVRTTPRAGQSVPARSRVTMIVSMGPSPHVAH